jgi:hypothetical protein
MQYPHPMEIRAKRRSLIIALAILLIVVAGVVYLCWPAGPYYRGRSLQSWLEDFRNPLRHASGLPLQSLPAEMGARMKGATNAVMAIGTNAIPTLLQFARARGRTVRGFGPVMFPPNGLFPSAGEKRAMALTGFMILGTNALAAKPALIALTKDSDPGVRMTAIESLFFLLQPDFKTLTEILVPFGHDPDPLNRDMALGRMRMYLAIITPEEAEKAGVYEAFPELRPSTAAGAH